MDKVLLHAWLSEVHLRREMNNVVLPNVPALAMFFQFTNECNWNDFCYEEVLALGDACELHFAEYYNRHCQSPDLIGTSATHPIVVSGDTAEVDSTDSGDSPPWSQSYVSCESSRDTAPWSVSYVSCSSSGISHDTSAPSVSIASEVAVLGEADAVSAPISFHDSLP